MRKLCWKETLEKGGLNHGTQKRLFNNCIFSRQETKEVDVCTQIKHHQTEFIRQTTPRLALHQRLQQENQYFLKKVI